MNDSSSVLRRVVRVKLRTTAAQADALHRTLVLASDASNRVSEVAFDRQIRSKYDLHHLTYGRLKALGLPAQIAVRCIARTADAYKTLRANARAGNLGRKDSRRWKRAFGKPIHFRDTASLAFDARNLSWNRDAQTVSISTIDGRIKPIPYVGEREQLAQLASHKIGETDLVEHQGKFYLVATLTYPAPALVDPDAFLGVDLGIVNIATDSTGKRYSGTRLNRVRNRNKRLRAKLQKKGTKSAKRVLKRLSGREARFARDTNHVISKQIVAEAKRTGKGISLEDLTGIRDRVRHRKPQRATLSSWAFAQLGQYITYKAAFAGIPVVHVDPAYTSQQCSECGHTEKKNRPDQATFVCRACGVSLHADTNAAINIAHRGQDDWAAINLPHAAEARQPAGNKSSKPTPSGAGS